MAKICVLMRKDHLKNPIQAGIATWCDKNNVPIFDLGETEKTKGYDICIIYYNKTIQSHAKKNVWWMCDLRPAYIFSDKTKYSSIYLCNKEHIEDYSKRFGCPVYYLPQCGDDRETPDSGRMFDSDIVFVGNFSSTYHQDRLEIISQIERDGVSVQPISGEGYSEDTKFIYKNSPFSLAVSPNAKGYTSNRLYNILSSGGFCITKYFDGIEDLFENNKHLVWFKDASEVKDIVNYYYEHQNQYDRIKAEGKALYDEKHTAKRRIEEILETEGFLQE